MIPIFFTSLYTSLVKTEISFHYEKLKTELNPALLIVKFSEFLLFLQSWDEGSEDLCHKTRKKNRTTALKFSLKNTQLEYDKSSWLNHSVWSFGSGIHYSDSYGDFSICYIVRVEYLFRYYLKLLSSGSCQSVAGLKIIAVFNDWVNFLTTRCGGCFTMYGFSLNGSFWVLYIEKLISCSTFLIMLLVSKQVLPNRVLTSKTLCVSLAKLQKILLEFRDANNCRSVFLEKAQSKQTISTNFEKLIQFFQKVLLLKIFNYHNFLLLNPRVNLKLKLQNVFTSTLCYPSLPIVSRCRLFSKTPVFV